MKTAEELNAIKNECEELNKEISIITGEELRQIAGSSGRPEPGRKPSMRGPACSTCFGIMIMDISKGFVACPSCGRVWKSDVSPKKFCM